METETIGWKYIRQKKEDLGEKYDSPILAYWLGKRGGVKGFLGGFDNLNELKKYWGNEKRIKQLGVVD